jgi:TetR/AcrR family transcriptional repressor of nem operon
MARPKEFERDVVLDRAMRVFWSRGYEATSIQHLVARMGIQRGSLYDTFGDKRALFFAAIDRYHQVVTTKLLAALEAPGSGKDAIRRFFQLKVELALEPGRPRGCLVTNSTAELASRDRGTATRVGAVLATIEAAFHRAVIRAQEAGEIDPARDPRGLARFLTSSAQGLSVMAKAAPDRAFLEDIVQVTLAALEAPSAPAGTPRPARSGHESPPRHKMPRRSHAADED